MRLKKTYKRPKNCGNNIINQKHKQMKQPQTLLDKALEKKNKAIQKTFLTEWNPAQFKAMERAICRHFAAAPIRTNKGEFSAKYRSFENLGDILRPDGKYYIEFSTGRRYYNSLPDRTYFAIGNLGNAPQSKPGAAYLFCNDGGTCLIPIIETATGEQVVKPEAAGHEIKNGELIPA